MRPEETIHFNVCNYIRLQYPDVMFITESSGLRVSKGLAMKLKRTRSNHVHADLYLMHPQGKYHGLIIELKAKSIYKKNGELLKNEHLQDQQNTIDALNKLGYYATFAVGFTEAKNIIDDYLNGNI